MLSERPENNQDYRREARVIRAQARQLHDAEARTQLLLIASLYEKLANLTDILSPLHARLADNSRIDPTEGADAL